MRKCYLKKEYLLESDTKHLDAFGFTVLNETPDCDNTIPTQRLSDGQYGCLPLYAIQFDTSPELKGEFVLVDGMLIADNIELN